MKRFWSAIFALLLIVAFVAPAQAELQDMWAKVYRNTGKLNADGSAQLTAVTSGITFKVLAKDSDTAETLYVYRSHTSLTNPVTTTNYASATACAGQVQFRVDPTDSTYDRYVDLIVVDTAGGYSAFVEDFDKYTHAIVIDERPNVMHHGLIWWTDSTAMTETSTGVTFAPDTFLHDVRVEVVTTTAAGTMNVGLYSYDSDGLRKDVVTTTAGYVADTGVITSGTSVDYYPVSTYGALLHTAITGTGAYTALKAVNGGNSYKGHVVLTAASGVLTYTGNSGASGAGFIHYWFSRMR